jgi:hypothetical protein
MPCSRQRPRYSSVFAFGFYRSLRFSILSRFCSFRAQKPYLPSFSSLTLQATRVGCIFLAVPKILFLVLRFVHQR